jgi:hypothetical protein
MALGTAETEKTSQARTGLPMPLPLHNKSLLGFLPRVPSKTSLPPERLELCISVTGGTPTESLQAMLLKAVQASALIESGAVQEKLSKTCLLEATA